jgi:hypothetical protein
MKRTAITLAVGLLLLGAACSDDDDGAGVLESENADEDEPTDEDSDDETTETTTEGETSEEEPDGEPIGTAQAQLQGQAGVARIRIDVISLERNDDHVELEMWLTNEEPASDLPPNDQLYWFPFARFADDAIETAPYDISGIGLVDQGEQKMYLPMLDSSGDCVCTGSDVMGERLYPAQSTTLVASYGGVPEDLEAIDLHIPDFPVIVGLEIRG